MLNLQYFRYYIWGGLTSENMLVLATLSITILVFIYIRKYVV